MLDVLRSKDKSVKSEEASTAQAETPHPFHAAAASGDAAACRAWLRSAGGVDAAGDDGVTALMYACSMSQAPIVKLLLESGASVDRVSAATGETPLHWLAASAASAPGPFEDWLSCARLMLQSSSVWAPVHRSTLWVTAPPLPCEIPPPRRCRSG